MTEIPGATGVAVAVVFGIGSHHDPPGRSGMAHMIEHLLVTGDTEAELAREEPRLQAELNNMFGGIPELGAPIRPASDSGPPPTTGAAAVTPTPWLPSRSTS